MIQSIRRRQKINKFEPRICTRLSKLLKETTVPLTDPNKIDGETDFAVNRYENLNKIQRVSLGVYMYDTIQSQQAAKAVEPEYVHEPKDPPKEDDKE